MIQEQLCCVLLNVHLVKGNNKRSMSDHAVLFEINKKQT